MIYVLGLLLVLYFGWRFGGLFRAWRAAGYPADPRAARNVRFMVGLILIAALATFFLLMAPVVTTGLVLSMIGAGALVIGMQFIRENLALAGYPPYGTGAGRSGVSASSPTSSSSSSSEVEDRTSGNNPPA